MRKNKEQCSTGTFWFSWPLTRPLSSLPTSMWNSTDLDLFQTSGESRTFADSQFNKRTIDCQVQPFLDLQVLPWNGLWLGHPIYRRLCWTKWREGCVASSLLQMIVVTKVTEVNFNEELQKFSYKQAYWRPSYIWRNKCFLSVLWECSGCINHRPTVIKTIKCVRFQGRHYITHLFWVLFYWLFLKVLAKPDREPVEKLDKGDQADSKEESADPAKAGDEVQPGHPWRPLKLCKMFYNCKLWGKNMKQLRRF